MVAHLLTHTTCSGMRVITQSAGSTCKVKMGHSLRQPQPQWVIWHLVTITSSGSLLTMCTAGLKVTQKLLAFKQHKNQTNHQQSARRYLIWILGLLGHPRIVTSRVSPSTRFSSKTQTRMVHSLLTALSVMVQMPLSWLRISVTSQSRIRWFFLHSLWLRDRQSLQRFGLWMIEAGLNFPM